MLKLIQIEFLKLRRRKFIWLMLLAALFMPLAAVFYFASVKGTSVEPIEFYKWTAFSYTPWIILPVVLGMLCIVVFSLCPLLGEIISKSRVPVADILGCVEKCVA